MVQMDEGGRAQQILLAEDDAISAKLALHFLQAAGYSVHHVNDGKTALELLTSRAFSLALLDMRMPFLSGIEVALRYREHEQQKNKLPLPMVALTANAFDDDRHACLAAGMNDFITKPVSRAALLSVVSKYLDAAAAS